MTGDVDIELTSPELARKVVMHPNVEANPKATAGGEYTVFKNTTETMNGGGFYEAFPELPRFAKSWRKRLGRDVDIKLRMSLDAISTTAPPSRGPIEFFRKESP